MSQLAHFAHVRFEMASVVAVSQNWLWHADDIVAQSALPTLTRSAPGKLWPNLSHCLAVVVANTIAQQYRLLWHLVIAAKLSFELKRLLNVPVLIIPNFAYLA